MRYADNDRIKWALHRDDTRGGRFEVGLKNLTKAEAHIVLDTLSRLEMNRAADVAEACAAFLDLDPEAGEVEGIGETTIATTKGDT